MRLGPGVLTASVPGALTACMPGVVMARVPGVLTAHEHGVLEALALMARAQEPLLPGDIKGPAALLGWASDC